MVSYTYHNEVFSVAVNELALMPFGCTHAHKFESVVGNPRRRSFFVGDLFDDRIARCVTVVSDGTLGH